MAFAAEWALRRGDGGNGGDWSPIDGPCTVAAAMPHLRGQDFDDDEWWFRARFDSSGDAAILGLDGIATAAQVWLNGEPLVTSSNMFVAHRCDVEQRLRAGGNELLVRCAPLNAELKARRPRPRWRTPMVGQQQLRWWRTTLLGRTPGWSPPVAPVGPWRDVWLSSREEAARRDARVEVVLDGRDGIVRCVHPFKIARNGREWHSEGGEVRIADVQLWWPHTHGEPALYESSFGPIGFRHVEVDNANGDFRLRVNGEAVFCRGAVWMPLDAASLRAAAQQYTAALGQVRAAGMNMLRVAGITVYEEDAFYDACDRAGVLVWQEFMFANMDYPASEAQFAASVDTEVRQQLARIARHPCIAVLCGNSEAEQQAAMWGAPRQAWEQPLFHETIPALCREIAPHVPYWPSSAHGGALPQHPDSGTTSYYGVGAYLRPLEDARRSNLKFATECLAFANVRSDATTIETPPRDLGASWDFADVTDHYLELLFHENARALRRTDPERYLALSRMTSAEVMAAAFAEWRRPGSSCGGALVLMLRDLQAGAGWGLLDDLGRPKACWHALSGILQPLAVFITDEGMNGLHIHAVNDSASAAAVEVQLQAWQHGETLVASGTRAIELAPRGNATIAAASLLDHFLDLNWSHRFGPLPCDVVVVSLRNAEGKVLSRAHFFPDRRALSAGRELGLQSRVLQSDSFEYEVAVRTQCFAYGVHFEVPGMTADEEYFHLDPAEEVRIRLRGTPRSGGWVRAVNALQPCRIEGIAS